MITVVKIGGAAVGAIGRAAELRRGGRDIVIVHGAGPQISQRCTAAGITPRFVAGQRFTDARVLEIVAATLAEENARIVGELEAAGVAARGMGDALGGRPVDDPRLGLVGAVTGVEQIGIRALLAAGLVPVLMPMAGGLNVNADHAAAAVAAALRASELVFLSDVPGVLDGAGRVIRHIRAGQAPQLIDRGDVTGGMVPKLHAGEAALAAGVWRVWIGAETMVTA